MRGLVSFLALSLRSRRARVLGLAAFGLLFLAAAATARLLTGGEHGHVELDPLFELGGTTLVSALLLLGWMIGRFPMIAVLVMTAGMFSDDHAAGHARLFAVRPRSMIVLYGMRLLLFMCVAALLSALVLPGFDLLMLGQWPDAGMFAVIIAQVLIYGSVTAILSIATRADAWIALFLGIFAIVWDALRRTDFFQLSAPAIRETVSVLLPPQGALVRIESAFAASQPVPWDAMFYVSIYAVLVLILAGVALVRREL